jgi:hypothetical protein
MNPDYIETFRRHRLLFLLPILVAGAIALWTALGAPTLYRSTASLWLDTPAGLTYATLGAPSPAADAQTMLNELMRTEYFANSIARQSPLEEYLRTHPSAGWGPSAVIRKLKGPPTMDDRIAAALGPSRVTSSVQGPHVFEINFDAASPQLATATLRVLIDEFRSQRTTLRRDALEATQRQVASATTALNEARASLESYLRMHPDTGDSDPRASALRLSVRNATTTVADATQRLADASAALTQGGTLDSTLRVLDEPRTPVGPTQGKRRIAMTVAAGLFGGMVFSILGIVVLTSGTRTFRLADPAGPLRSAEPLADESLDRGRDDGERPLPMRRYSGLRESLLEVLDDRPEHLERAAENGADETASPTETGPATNGHAKSRRRRHGSRRSRRARSRK